MGGYLLLALRVCDHGDSHLGIQALMSHPHFGVMRAFVSEAAARAFWTELEDNDRYTIFSVVIDAFTKNPANEPVAWVILSEKDPVGQP